MFNNHLSIFIVCAILINCALIVTVENNQIEEKH